MSEEQSLEATPTSTTRKDGYDINNFTLLFNLFPTSSELFFITQPDGESQ
jgi:hypothetical protein